MNEVSKSASEEVVAAKLNRAFAVQVVEELRAGGFEALWAGGCVRDLLLGNEPHDYDVATSATPEQVRQLFGRRRTIAVGAAFGVMIVLPNRREWSEGQPEQIEVATFRTDSTYSDGRRPDSVQFSTPAKDAQRRDFTINGMFYDPVAERVIDYVGGEEDLRRGIVRAIGDASDRIAEDKLRMLRAIRFAARFSFSLDKETADAISDSAAEVKVVSGERIAAEVTKTLATQRCSWAIEQWHELGLLNAVFPELVDTWRRWPEVVSLLDALNSSSWRSRLASVMYAANLDDSVVSMLRERWKLSNEDTNCLVGILAAIEPLTNANALRWSEVQPFVVTSHREESLAVAEAVACLESKTDSIESLRSRIASGEDLSPQPWVSGQDLIELGLRPSPRFKELLSKAWQMQLDGELESPADALEWIKNAGHETG